MESSYMFIIHSYWFIFINLKCWIVILFIKIVYFLYYLTVKAAFEQLKGEVMNPSRHLQKECSRQYGQSIWGQVCLTWAIRSVWLSLLGRQSKKPRDGNPLAVQWLRLRVSTAGVPQVGALVKELRSCMPKWGA